MDANGSQCALRPAGCGWGREQTYRLSPSFSGFEAEALFCRQFHYEPALVGWLEDNVAAKYDLIIEIGANVGIYTVFLDALYRSASLPRDVTPRIVSFEPSEKAYRRLSRQPCGQWDILC